MPIQYKHKNKIKYFCFLTDHRETLWHSRWDCGRYLKIANITCLANKNKHRKIIFKGTFLGSEGQIVVDHHCPKKPNQMRKKTPNVSKTSLEKTLAQQYVKIQVERGSSNSTSMKKSLYWIYIYIYNILNIYRYIFTREILQHSSKTLGQLF